MDVFYDQIVKARHVDVVIAEILHDSAVESEKAEGQRLSLFRAPQTLNAIGRVAGGGDADDDVAFLHERSELPGEYLVIADVVRKRRKEAHISVQANNAQVNPKAVLAYGHREVVSEVKRGCGAPSVSHREYGSTGNPSEIQLMSHFGDRAAMQRADDFADSAEM